MKFEKHDVAGLSPNKRKKKKLDCVMNTWTNTRVLQWYRFLI